MRYTWLVILLAALAAAPAAACSPEDGYKIPTNFDLVRKAKVIVLALVVDVPSMDKAMGGTRNGQLVSLQPIRFLKGEAPTESLKLMGWRAPGNWAGIPTPTTLFQSHFSAGLGACVRQFYQPGELVVAMFASDPAFKEMIGTDFGQIFDPFARVVETIEGDQDVWVQAVETYVGLLAGPPDSFDARLATEQARRAAIDTPASQAIAVDLAYYRSRKEKRNVWGSAATPLSVIAKTAQPGVGLYCLAGTPPGLILDKQGSAPVELAVGDRVYRLTAAPDDASEWKMIVEDGAKATKALFRFDNPAAVFADLKGASAEVRVKRGDTVLAGGKPLDALLRWASQCEKLQSQPRPKS